MSQYLQRFFFILTLCLIPFSLPARDVIYLPQDIWEQLLRANWQPNVGDAPGIWVSVARQRVLVIQNGQILFSASCSTAVNGSGNVQGSFQTPLGWHAVAQKIGDHLPLGAIFKERQYTGQIWQKDQNFSNGDLILTRILWLKGLERGVNQGIGIDTLKRCIYIHGTHEEEKIGIPASHGCIRLSNRHVVELFNLVRVGTPVLITIW